MPIGLVDDPSLRTQETWWLDFSGAGGHVAADSGFARADGASHHCRSSTTSATGESAERFEASQYRPCCHA